MRVADLEEEASAADLTTVSAADLRGAFQELAAAVPGGLTAAASGHPTGLTRTPLAPDEAAAGHRALKLAGRGGYGAAGGSSRSAAIRLAGSRPGVPDDVHQRVQHRMPVFAPVQQALRGLPQFGRVAAPEPVGEHQVPVEVQRAAGPPVRVVVIGGQQGPPVALARPGPARPGRCRRTCRAAPGTRTPGGAAPPGRRPAAAGRPARRPGRTRSGRGRPGRTCPSSRTPRPASRQSCRRPGPGGGPPSAPRPPAHAASRAARPGPAAPCAAASRAGTSATLAGLIRSGRPKSRSQP